MPAESQAQQAAMAIALHHPEKLHEKNKGLLEMKKSDLRDFASTPRHNLPSYAHAHKARKARHGG